MASEVLSLLPHRHPFLFVDRALEVVPGERAVAVKNVSWGEPYFQGHFPGFPVMPGVLIVAALAQTSALALLAGGEEEKIGLFAGIEETRFRRPVRPGDTLRLEAEILWRRGRMAASRGRAYVEGRLVCEAKMQFALVDRAYLAAGE